MYLILEHYTYSGLGIRRRKFRTLRELLILYFLKIMFYKHLPQVFFCLLETPLIGYWQKYFHTNFDLRTIAWNHFPFSITICTRNFFTLFLAREILTIEHITSEKERCRSTMLMYHHLDVYLISVSVYFLWKSCSIVHYKLCKIYNVTF